MRKPALIGAAALVCALTVGGGTAAALTKTVTITVDGAQRQVTTLAGSVNGALSAAGLHVAPHDTVAPAGSVSISDGSQIALNRGRQFSVTIDGRTQQIWTTARTVDEALAQLGRNPADYQLSANRSRVIPLGGLQVSAATLNTVSLAGSHVGATPESVTSAARTVGELLAQQGISLGVNDRVTPAPATALRDGLAITVRTLPTVVIADGAHAPARQVSERRTVGDLLTARHIAVGKDDVISPARSTPLTQGLTVTITRVGYRLTTKSQVVPQPADQSVTDDALDLGTSVVTRHGQAGALQITYRTKVVNGKPGVAREVGRRSVQQAIATVIHVGTHVAPVVVAPVVPSTPVPTPAPTESSSAATGSVSPGTPPSPTSAAQPTPSSSQSSQSQSQSGSGSGGSGSASYYDDSSHWSVNWDAVAHCESTNNWSTNTGNGYYGGLQFDSGTWLSAGGGQYADRADHASKSEQIAVAEKLYASRGLAPWSCGYAAG